MSETFETAPIWDESGLPDECPECGEDEALAAFADAQDETGPVSAEVLCGTFDDSDNGCGHRWDWQRDAAETDTTAEEVLREDE